MARLTRIWLKPVKGEPLQEVEHASVRSNHGLVGNAERGGHRQVTVLSAEDWEAANAQAGSELTLQPAGPTSWSPAWAIWSSPPDRC